MLDFLTLSIINKRTCVLTSHFITSKKKHLTMKQIFNILTILTLCTSAFTFVSCQETDAVSDYDNWEERNQAFVDSIARVCAANEDGKWVKFCAFNLDPEVEKVNVNNNHYIYVHKNVDGTGSYRPQYKDIVRVHYLGHLIPSDTYKNGFIFDRSYNGYTLNEKTDVPRLYSVGSMTIGISTAIMQMVEGNDWTVYIPYELGFGTEDCNIVQGYSLQYPNVPSSSVEKKYSFVHGRSTLIINIKLSKVYKYGVDTDYTWY